MALQTTGGAISEFEQDAPTLPLRMNTSELTAVAMALVEGTFSGGPGSAAAFPTGGGRATGKRVELQLPEDKALGEFSELAGSNYEGSYRPARMGLRRVLEQGRMRNPLHMQQNAATPWSARRPASRDGGRDLAVKPRSASAGRTRGAAAAAVAMGTVPRPFDADRLMLHGGLQSQSGGAQGDGRGPGVLQPQRIELPSYLNTPARKSDSEPLSPEERTQTIRRIQDLELLTFACRRASKVREEGRAHFSMGVYRDNLGQYTKAIESYNNFLRVCKECNDSQGCALAYHCIAVDMQLQGGGQAAGATVDISSGAAAQLAGRQGGVKPDVLRKAIFFHNKHRESSDSVGKFVAHLNMGLAYAQLGEKEASTVNHQYALRYALQLHSLEGQSLAIGSLGFTSGMYENDPDKMRVLVERYVDLCEALRRPRNQATALKKLGIIAGQQGDTEQSVQYFQQAIQRARETGDREAEKDCSVRLGIAAGQARMDEHLNGLLQQQQQQQSPAGPHLEE